MALSELEDDFSGMRSALDLSLPEQIVVWSLRRYRAGEGRLELLAATYRHVFGLAEVEAALSAFGQLIGTIERHCRRQTPPARMDRLHLSPTESCVLRLVMAAQIGDEATAEAVAAWLVTREGGPALVRAAFDFAACLAQAGQRLTGRESAAMLASLGRAPHRAEGTLPSVERTAGLTPDETMLLQGIRIWVACAKESRCGGHDLLEHLSAHGAAGATPSLHGILYNSSVAAIRAIDVRCRRCPNLSPDEARMIHAIACAQRNLRAGVSELLQGWLPPAAVRLTIDAVMCAGVELASAAVVLPWRAWDFAALEQLSAPPPHLVEPDKRVLH
ncbi:MAG: hypothetical protein AB7S71_18300 [Dongiaceae bacterium]